jgi:cytochrome c oxidase assembly factor CtaG
VFDYAAGHGPFHEAEHLVFFALGLLFWSRAFDSPPFRARLTRWRRLAYLLAAAAAESVLALIILAAHDPIYTAYEGIVPRPEHLTVLADQQLGGAIMLEPASIPLLLAILWSIGTLVGPSRRARESAA